MHELQASTGKSNHLQTTSLQTEMYFLLSFFSAKKPYNNYYYYKLFDREKWARQKYICVCSLQKEMTDRAAFTYMAFFFCPVFFFSVRSGRKQLASIVNFLLSVVATFAFGYVASQYAFPSEAVVGI